MNRKPFTPQAGTSYRNKGGGNYVCIAAAEQKDVFIMQNKTSGWTFNAHGIGIYDDDSIDWDYSTEGHFVKISGMPQMPPDPKCVFMNAVRMWGKEAQTDMMIEEMAELTKEIMNERRGRDHNIAEEMADVQIMLSQMEIVFANGEELARIYWEKVARLDQRLKDRQRGEDCDTCVHSYIYQGDIQACRRKDNELDCQYEEREARICPVCEKEVYRDEMSYTKDCHGIPYRLVCEECYVKLMEKGYDGEYYDETDEQIEDDY